MTLRGRREFLAGSLAALGATALTLPATAEPTPESGHADDYLAFLASEQSEGACAEGAAGPFLPDIARASQAPANITEDNILGPYYRPGAPFRAKITPPVEPGVVLVVRGRVWGHDTRQPLTGVTLDIWQANAEGRYDNDDPKQPPAAGVFMNRARLLTDERGYYEYETVHPGRYQIGPNLWRPSHIHYLVQHTGYRRLVTQLYFDGDPMNAKDQFIKPSLIIKLDRVPTRGQEIEVGQFDVVLAKA
jgi:catechol 1,2-dioxygenase